MRRIKLKITLIYPTTVITSVCVYIQRSRFPHLEEARSQCPVSLCLWDGSTHSICGEYGGREGARIPPLESSLPSAVWLLQRQWRATGSSGVPVLRDSVAAPGIVFPEQQRRPKPHKRRLLASSPNACAPVLSSCVSLDRGPHKPSNAPSRFSFQGCESLNNSKWLDCVQVGNILKYSLSSTKKRTLIWTLWLSKVIPKHNNEGLWVSVRAWSKADYSICQWQHTDFILDLRSPACYLQTPSGAVRNQRWHSVR